ncbi:MAG TPA: AMP-binding protein, partial [Dongiaceae bacterium]|nr:AMP-binding protein [Dongiaceae bacterium]
MTSLSEILDMAKVLTKALKVKPLPRDTRLSLGLMVEQNAARNPSALMCLFEGTSITWGQFNTLANRFAHQLKQLGIRKGDVVSIMMDNRIENLAAITAVAKVGGASAMINTHLTDEPLLHCITSVNSRKLIVGEEWLDSINAIRSQLSLNNPADFIFIRDQGKEPCPDWATPCRPDDFSAHNLPETQTIQLKDLAYYIFTSGTTGLPKASVITHDRHHRMSTAFAEVALDMKPTDRIYVCLPLYHSSAMFIGFGSITRSGASMFLRRKFSASNFLDEARQYNTNCFSYIGELCRYLLLQPEKPNDAINP